MPIRGSKKLGVWPCQWIVLERELESPFVLAYRRAFPISQATTAQIHVTADERYELFLDGVRIGRGSERSEPNHWCFETYDLHLDEGEHILGARVWTQGSARAYAQMSSSPGFLLSPLRVEHQELFGTGVAEWEVKKLEGYTFTNPMAAWGTGQNVIVDGEYLDEPFGSTGGEGWTKAVPTYPGLSSEFCPELDERRHVLMPALLPAMMDQERFIGRVRHVAKLASKKTAKLPVLEADHLPLEAISWQNLLDAQIPVVIPPHTVRRVLIDLDDYYCAYPHLEVSGGKAAMVRIHWQEALFEGDDFKRKGNRDEIYGKHFITLWWHWDGVGDTFKLCGAQHRVYEPLWWQAGRYVEVVVKTEDEEVTIERLSFLETRYPMENESSLRTSDEEINHLVPILARSLHMCSHETYMDCPYFEQLAYIGDSRLEALITYASSSDSRLPKKSLMMFDLSRISSGLTQSRYPSRVRQIIPPFTLWWICMVYDYALWRGEPDFILKLMPGVRMALDAFRSYTDPSGLIGAPPGWNFVDWMPDWKDGVPPSGVTGVSGVINWQVVLAAKYAGQLEEWLGEPELAARQKRWVGELTQRIDSQLWVKSRGLYADDLSGERFSMHTQCLALLSGEVAAERARGELLPSLAKNTTLSEPSIYFRHYVFEALQSQGKADDIPAHLDLWLQLRQQGFKTTFEEYDSDTTRSDCHGWGAHPLYHYFASIVGVRPGSFGFDHVHIRPALSKLGWAEGQMPHPKGTIKFRLEETARELNGWVEIPAGTTGTLFFGGHEERFTGRTTVHLQRKKNSP